MFNRRRANAYYWSKVLPAFANQVYTDVHYRWVHDQIANELLPFGDDPEMEIQRRSIAIVSMSDEDFLDYFWRVLIWATLEGVELPEPVGVFEDEQ